jgi:hypothetical protein
MMVNWLKLWMRDLSYARNSSISPSGGCLNAFSCHIVTHADHVDHCFSRLHSIFEFLQYTGQGDKGISSGANPFYHVSSKSVCTAHAPAARSKRIDSRGQIHPFTKFRPPMCPGRTSRASSPRTPRPSHHGKNLILINLSFNAFTGSIPEEFAELEAVMAFSVEGNKLSGNIPDSIRN